MAESTSSLHQKQAKEEQQRQIEALESRLALLQKESNAEQRRQKKIQEEADRAYLRKKQHDEYVEQERNRHQLKDEQLTIRQQQNNLKKHQRQLQIEQVRQALREAKHQEFMHVEQQSRKYAAIIQEHKTIYHLQKLQKKSMVIEDKEQSKQRFLEYWHDRVNAYKQQHNMVRSSLQSDLDSNQRQLQLLEQQEMRLFEELKRSQQLTKQASKQLDDARKLDSMTYASHYSLPKPNKFQKIMSINAKSTSAL